MSAGPSQLSRARLQLVVGLFALELGACTPTTDLSPSRVRGYDRVARTQGSSVVVTQDERVAVVCNRMDGVVSILRLDPSRPTAELVTNKRHDILMHPLNASRPWVAVIGPDDDTAFVLVRGLRQVVQIVGLHGDDPHQGATFSVGAEPTSLVITPSGKGLFVANSGDGTVSSILPGVNPAPVTWDLNARLAISGYLGHLIGDGSVAPAVWTRKQLDRSLRPALAHPRALAITDDGDSDDSDETLYASEFFGQPLPEGAPGGPDDMDHSRVGVIYPISLLTGQAPPDAYVIQLDPVSVSLTDSEGKPTACYPNQLYSLATSGNRLYAAAVCASPSGPIEPGPDGPLQANNFKTVVHSAVFSIDTANNSPAEPPLVLTDALSRAFAGDMAMPTDVRMPLIPAEINVLPPDAAGNRAALLSALGSSAIYPIHFAADGTDSVGVAGRRYIPTGENSMPTGTAFLSDGRALVADDHAPSLGAFDLEGSHLAASVAGDDWQAATDNDPSEVVSDDVRDGRQLFATGLKGWSFLGQSWSSCESCHPEGLSDGVTWRFARGPRRTISLAGTYYRDESKRRILLWGANIDEVHDVEAIARRVSGGVGGVVWNPYVTPLSKDCRLLYDGKTAPTVGDSPNGCPNPLTTSLRNNGLNGSLAALTRMDRGNICQGPSGTCDTNGSADWDRIDAFVRSVQAPQRPTTLDERLVRDGAKLFVDKACNACHAGSAWTLSHVFYEPGGDANGNVPFTAPNELSEDQVPQWRGTLRTRAFSVSADAPPAFRTGAGAGPWTFRNNPSELPLDATKNETPPGHELNQLVAPADDRLRCALRNVGTFGVAASDPKAPRVNETRRVVSDNVYVDKEATSKDGFNIPSLVGLAAGAPYFHSGVARTLEEVFDPNFAEHSLLGVTPLTGAEVPAMVSYLLSLDESGVQTPPDVASLPYEVDLCAQFGSSP